MSVFTITLQEASAIFGNEVSAYGLDTFPTPFDTDVAASAFRDALGRKIVDHYWNREIGLESFSMWRFNMRRKMNEIMPYYVQLYKTEKLITADPLSTMKMNSNSTQQQSGKADGSSKNDSATATTAKAVSSSYPQTMLDDNDTGNYAEAGQDSAGTGTGSATASDTRNESSTGQGSSTTSGYAGAVSDLLTGYRATLLNIDLMVIRDVEELFMQSLDSGDYWTQGNGMFV